MIRCLSIAAGALMVAAAVPNGLSLDDVLAAKRDLWGEAAMREANGPSYQFFARLLPPLRYVDAKFRHYPIILGMPGAKRKARWISDGSGVNLPGELWTWHDQGLTPVAFSVGSAAEPFGKDSARIVGPKYADGYLPIVNIRYRHGASEYRQEAFAAIGASNGTVVYVSFSLANGKTGVVHADLPGLHVEGPVWKDAKGIVRAWHGPGWRLEGSRATADVAAGGKVWLAVADDPPSIRLGDYDVERKRSDRFWKAWISRAATIETPEKLVNDAYRAVLLGTLALTIGDTLYYSALNLYEQTFEAECGDAVRAMALFGIPGDGRFVTPMLQRPHQQGLGFHDTAFKMQLLAHYYWLSKDSAFVRKALEPMVAEAREGIRVIEPGTGLLPREAYCGDISTPVYSLNSNANFWRGLRDLSVVLTELGDKKNAAELKETAERMRRATLIAVEKSVRKDVTPPFVPIALFGEEQPSDRLTDTKLGSYWDLMAPYVLGSGVFGVISQESRWIRETLQQHGGLCMGMVRFHQHSGYFANDDAVDDLYTLRYVLDLLQVDEPDRALVTFYGKLAQGFTRDTFIAGEGTGLRSLGPHGRSMYLPPNAAANALFLQCLRYLMIQDWDMDDDGKPETLRLMFATPRTWLSDRKRVRIESAPTAFGKVSVTMVSDLRHHKVVAAVDLPARSPQRTLLRFRVPDGHKVVSAHVGARKLRPDSKGTVDLSGMKGRVKIVADVRPTKTH